MESWTVAELKSELASRGLKRTGNKADLIARLQEVTAGSDSQSDQCCSGAHPAPHQHSQKQVSTFVPRSASFAACSSSSSALVPSTQALAVAPARLSAPAGLAAAGAQAAGKKRRLTEGDSEERRQRSYREFASIAVRQRIDRALEHRLYLIEARIEEQAVAPAPASSSSNAPALPAAADPAPVPTGHFAILGTQGKAYDVVIQDLPRCTCPDFRNNNQNCKHIIFVYLRVLKLSQNNPILWQAALVSSELREALGGPAADRLRNVDPHFVAAEAVRRQYAINMGQAPAEGPAGPQQRPVEGGECPVCCEEFGREAVVWCRALCGNNVHKACFDQWRRSKKGAEVTCPMCRSPWQEGAAPATGAKGKGHRGYMDLGALQPGLRPASLEELYPETHMWIGANQGNRQAIARRAAVLRGG